MILRLYVSVIHTIFKLEILSSYFLQRYQVFLVLSPVSIVPFLFLLYRVNVGKNMLHVSSPLMYCMYSTVEIEINGLMTYDRKEIKMPVADLKALHNKLYNPELAKMAIR